MKYKNGNLLPGFWRCKVIDVNDTLKKGRIKIEILSESVSSDSSMTAWAYPANNPIGGRSPETSTPYGSMMIPPLDSFVYVFFEGGLIDRPRYIAGLDINYGDNLPENILGNEFWNKWTLFRSPDGRAIIISDDKSDCRTEITGKKRLQLTKENPEKNVYTIETNQSTILIDDRENLEKILIKDYKGNYINIDSKNDEIEIESKKKMKIKAGGNISIHVTGDADIKTTGNTKVNCDGNVAIDANKIFLNCGATANPESPDGNRDTNYK